MGSRNCAWDRCIAARNRCASALFAMVVLSGLAAPLASAQGLRPVIFTPSSPVAGEAIQVAFDTNICELVIDLPDEVDIVRMGNNIDVIVDGNVADDIILCTLPPGRGRFNLGALPPGRYTVRIVIRSIFGSFPLFPPSASGTVVVSAAPIPGSSGMTLGILAVLTFLVGLFAVPARRTSTLTIAGHAPAATTAAPGQVRARAADDKPV